MTLFDWILLIVSIGFVIAAAIYTIFDLCRAYDEAIKELKEDEN